MKKNRKHNRRSILEKVGTVSSIGLVGTAGVGKVAGEDETNLSKKEKAKADQVIKIVNRDDISEKAKKQRLKKYDRKIIEYAIFPHSFTVSTESGNSSDSVGTAAVSENMTTTVTNTSKRGNDLWQLTLKTWWDYTGTDIESVSWDVSTDTWNGWSTVSTNVTDSTTENYDGGIGSWTVNGTGTFENSLNQQSCEITHVMYDHGDSDRTSCADP